MRVQGEGPVPCVLCLVGEGPGLIESKLGRPFVETAPAGAELTRYLNGYSLPVRSEVYITNLIKAWEKGAPTKGKGVTPEDIARDEWELNLELATVQPRIVGALGLYAARWFLGPSVTMDASHGLLFKVRYCPTCGSRSSVLSPIPLCPCADLPVVYVMNIYHPAAGLHQPELAARTAYDMAQLSAILKLPSSEWDSRCWHPAPSGVYTEHTGWASPGWAPEQGLDTEGTPEAPWGLSCSVGSGKAIVKRCGLVYPGNDEGEPMLWPENLPNTTWILHNYLWDAHVLKGMGVGEIPEDQFHDTMLAAYLLGVEPQGLKELAFRHLGRVRPSYEEVVGEWQVQYGKTGKPKKKKKLVLKSLDEIPLTTAIQYAGGDADDTLSIKPILWKRVQDLGLEEVYEMDRKVLPLYARMEEVGLPVDLAYYRQFKEDIEGEILISSLSLQEDYPGLNPDSPDQVAALLFDHLKLPGGKKTPTGKRFSTQDKYLETLTGYHPVVARIQDHRELQKTKTFIDDVFQFSRPNAEGDLRLYFRLLPTRVVSGRVAYKDPNVGAFPKRSERGKQFRRGVRARPGRSLGSWDFCLAPGTRILTADLRWIPIEKASVGQTLIGIEEHHHTVEGWLRPRRTKTTTIVRMGSRIAETIRIVLSNGRQVVASLEHPWLAKRRRIFQWVKSRDLRIGDQLAKFVEPWAEDTSYDGGWLAGFLDGEGSLNAEGATVTVTQKQGPLLEKAQALLLARGYEFHDPVGPKMGGFPGSSTASSIWMCGAADCMRLLGELRPGRLLSAAPRLWEGREPIKAKRGKWSPNNYQPVTIVDLVPNGIQEVVSLETTAHTFVAEGLFTHNSQIELRVLALDSAPSPLQGLIASGVDLHERTAERIFGVPPGEQDQCLHRIPAKTTNFSIIMGTTKMGLAEQQRRNGYPFPELTGTHFTSLKARREAEEEVCDRWIKSVIDDWGIAGYIADRHAEARRYGGVRDRWGRIRWLPSVLSPNRTIREEAQRQAQAFPPQAGARGFVKHWESEVWRTVIRPLRAEGWYVEPLLDLHDDLVLEFDEELGGMLKPLIESIAVNLFQCAVPIVCKGSVGPVWGDL
jgi:uracil-DNA glycosylase family 4